MSARAAQPTLIGDEAARTTSCSSALKGVIVVPVDDVRGLIARGRQISKICPGAGN